MTALFSRYKRGTRKKGKGCACRLSDCRGTAPTVDVLSATSSPIRPITVTLIKCSPGQGDMQSEGVVVVKEAMIVNKQFPITPSPATDSFRARDLEARS